MRTNKQLKVYREYTKADMYIIGFEYHDYVYITTTTRLRNGWLYVRECSHNRGKAIALRLSLKEKRKLIAKGATPVCPMDSFTEVGYNKGDALEYLCRQVHGLPHKHDNVPFYKGCDMVVNNIGYSIKWENAQLCLYSTCNKLSKARE